MIDFIQDVHFDCDTSWKHEFVDELLSIEDIYDLVDRVMIEQHPDDYDGTFTEEQKFFADKSYKFLKWRISLINTPKFLVKYTPEFESDETHRICDNIEELNIFVQKTKVSLIKLVWQPKII